MKLRINKNDLQEGISAAIRATTSNSTQTILSNLFITAKNDSIQIIGNNLELYIETKEIYADVYEEGTICLDAKLFYEIVKKAQGIDIQITVEKNNSVIITSNKRQMKMHGIDASDFPLITHEIGPRFNMESRILCDLLKQTIYAISSDNAKPILTGSLIEVENNLIKTVGCDMFRMAYNYAKIKDVKQAIRVIVAKKSLVETINFLSEDEDVEIQVTQKYIVLELDKYRITSRFIEGEYINYNNIFNEQNAKTTAKINRKEFINVLECALLLASKEACIGKVSKATLKIEKGQITTKVNNEHGALIEETTAEIEGKELEIIFNTKYLLEALSVIKDDEVTMHFGGELSPCIIQGNGNNKHLVVPMMPAKK